MRQRYVTMAGNSRGARSGKRALSLKGRALALLAQREHSVPELRRKLLRHAHAERADSADVPASQATVPGHDPAAAGDSMAAGDALSRVEAVIDWLRGHGYVSDERFAESRVHVRAPRYGNLRIRQELAQHGLTLSPEAAQALKDSELERATEVWRRKFGVPPSNAHERARQSRFLIQRGFSTEVIRTVLRGFSGDTTADPDDSADAE